MPVRDKIQCKLIEIFYNIYLNQVIYSFIQSCNYLRLQLLDSNLLMDISTKHYPLWALLFTIINFIFAFRTIAISRTVGV